MSNAIEFKNKFTDLLKSMFQLDQPELDFGLYRIMHAKADRIKLFLETQLFNQIDAVFLDADQADQNQAIEAAKQTLIRQLGEGAFDEKGELVEHFRSVPAAQDYLKALSQAKSGKGNLSERAIIYDHLIRFFSRYYDGGDFMSRRYHVAENKSRAAAYAVPYDGSEVYLHWANKDQYYIKTTESFNLYSFDIVEAARVHAEQASKTSQPGLLDLQNTSQLANKRIHFKLVDAEQGEHNNNKESEKRQFFIRAEHPVALNEAGELEVYFEFRVATKKDAISAEREKQLKARFGKDANKGDLPNLYITQVIQDALLVMQEQPGLVDFVAFVQILAPTDKIKQRPLLTKYINNYTSKNTMDYFIHKDLGGFLQRELDFYIKNEIMRLDDIEQADEAHYGRLLKQIKTLRGVAKEIIQFLAQLEDFQKKLWLKKKFVTETQYCITLDRLAEQPGLVESALNNEAQRQEWVKLFAIDLAELDAAKALGIEAVLAKEKFKYLVLDTQFFNAAFKDELLAEMEDLDEQSNGLLINSDNFQALNLMQTKYNKVFDGIYIDPPYNTDASEIVYKNGYKDSSWCSLIYDRVSIAKNLIHDRAVTCTTIDEYEVDNLSMLLKDALPNYSLRPVIIEYNHRGRVKSNFAITHEYGLWCIPNGKDLISRKKDISEDIRRNLRRTGTDSNREDSPSMFYGIEVDLSTLEIVSVTSPLELGEKIPEHVKTTTKMIWPIDDSGIERRWYYGSDRVLKEKDEGTVWAKKIKGQIQIHYHQDGKPKMRKSIWSGALLDSSTYGSELLNSMFGLGKVDFSFPKSIHAVKDSLEAINDYNSAFYLDYFAGSGTTHATIELNREDAGQRKFALVEMGNYFNTATKPRVIKSVYSKIWDNGSPLTNIQSLNKFKNELKNFKEKKKALIGLEDREEFEFQDQLLNGKIQSLNELITTLESGDVEETYSPLSVLMKYLRLEQYEDTLNNLIDSRTYNPESVPKDFILSYLLEAETAESPSLLNLQQFSQPRHYQLKIKRPNSDQSLPQVIDLVETFNWLIGLNVEKLDKWRAYDCEFAREHDPELPQDQHTRLKVTRMEQADAYANDAPVYQVRTVKGWVRRQPGNDELRDSVLVIWRNLSDDPEKDSAVLEALLDKFKIDQADSQFDKIYINGSHGLQLHGSAKTRLLSLEDAFITKMWEGA